MPKYRDTFRKMLADNEALFTEFAELHHKYHDNQSKWQEEYNTKGKPVVDIIREYEQKLCGKMERGNNAVFSSKLSEKFWNEVRAFFPMIDYVGVTISKK